MYFKKIEEIIKELDDESYCNVFASGLNVLGSYDCTNGNSFINLSSNSSGGHNVINCLREYEVEYDMDANYYETIIPENDLSLPKCEENKNSICLYKPEINIQKLLFDNTKGYKTYKCDNMVLEDESSNTDEGKDSKEELYFNMPIKLINNISLGIVSLKEFSYKYNFDVKVYMPRMGIMETEDTCEDIPGSQYTCSWYRYNPEKDYDKKLMSHRVLYEVTDVYFYIKDSEGKTMVNFGSIMGDYRDCSFYFSSYDYSSPVFYPPRENNDWIDDPVLNSYYRPSTSSNSKILDAVTNSAQNFRENVLMKYGTKALSDAMSCGDDENCDRENFKREFSEDRTKVTEKYLLEFKELDNYKTWLVRTITDGGEKLDNYLPLYKIDKSLLSFCGKGVQMCRATTEEGIYEWTDFYEGAQHGVNETFNEGSIEKTQTAGRLIYAAIDTTFGKGKMNKNIFAFEQYEDKIIPVGYLANNENTPLKFDVITRDPVTFKIKKVNEKPLTYCEAMEYTGEKFSKYCNCKDKDEKVITQYEEMKDSSCKNAFGCIIRPVKPGISKNR